jgi:predicted ATPase
MSGYRREIRDSDIRYLEEKVSAGSYGAYLRRITLRRVRGFSDRVVSFDFPVTALVGPNGGGKSTILGGRPDLQKHRA